MVVPAGAEVTLYYSINGALAMNRLGAVISGNPVFNQAFADTLGASIKSTWTADLGGHCSSQVSLVRVGVRDLRADNLHEFRDTSAAVVGTAVGDSLPGSVAFCVTLRTATAGKSGRGRVFIPGFAETRNAGAGVADATAQTQAVIFVQHVNVNLQAQGLSLAVLTRPQLDTVFTKTVTEANGTKTEKVLSHQTAKSGATHLVTTIESRNLNWESQRRRINGRGLPPAVLFGGLVVPAQ